MKGMDPGEQADEIVLPAKREHRVDQVVPDAGLALLDLETVGEEVADLLLIALKVMSTIT